MIKSRALLGCCALISAALLSACGGSGGASGSGSQALSVAPSLGVITNATVRVYQADGTTLIVEGDSGAGGEISIAHDGSYSGPMIVAVIGDDDAQYYDEASGTTLAFGAGRLLHAMVPAGTTRTAVTMLTELAYQLGALNAITLTDTTINQLNDRVRQALAPEISSLLTPPLAFDGATTSGSLDASEAGRYALRLAALAQLGASDATPALTLMAQLIGDFSDGTLDGQDASGAIPDLLYTPASFAGDLAAQLANLAGSYGTAALQSALAGYPATGTGIDVSDVGGGAGSSLPPGVAGQIVTMEYCCAGTGSPYANGDQVLFTFSSSGSLMLTDQYTVVAESFTLRGSEYIWVDGANAIEYALSLNNGAIHEVNLYGLGGTPFYGQFAPVAGTGGGTPIPDGDGAALAGGNGATGTVGATTHTYSGHPVANTPLYTVNPLDNSGLFDAYDGTSAITRWSINGFPAAAGTYSCDTNGGLPALSLTLNGTPYQADQCTIEIISASSTAVEGRFAAHLVGAGGAELGTVSDGYFRYTPDDSGGGGSGTLPALFTELAGSYQAADTTLPEVFGNIMAGHMTLDLTIGNDGSVHYIVRDKDDDSLLFDETISWDGSDDSVSGDGAVVRLNIIDEFTEAVTINKKTNAFEFHLDVPLFIPGVGNGTRDAQWDLPYQGS